MKKTKIKLILTLLVFKLFSLNSYSQTVITNTPSTKYQTMKGWGTSLCWWANLVGGMPQSSIDEVSRRIAVEANLNFFRFNIGGGENPTCQWGHHMRKDGGDMPGYRSFYPNDQGFGVVDLSKDFRQIAVMNKLASLRAPYGDLISQTFSNSPPYYMTKTFCTAGEWNGNDNIAAGFEDDYADYLCSVTSRLRSTYPSWNIKYLEPFNEPYVNCWKAGANQEGCKVGASTQSTVLWRIWQSQQTYGISDIGRVASDNNSISESIQNVNDLKNNHSGEYNGLSHIATHTYFGTWQEKANLQSLVANTGKTVWQTETGPLNWTTPSGGQAWWSHYDMAYRLVEDIRNLRAEVWCNWQALSVDDGWGLIQHTNWDPNNPYKAATLKNTRSFFILKQIASYAKAGYTQIGNSNGNSITFLKPDNKEVVVVIVNNSSSTRSYSVDLTGFQTVSSFKTYRTSGGDSSTENARELTTSSRTQKGLLSGNKIAYTAPVWSVTTFVVTTPGLSNTLKVASPEIKNTQDLNLIDEDNPNVGEIENIFEFYPNPTSDIVTIDLKSTENTKVEIFDIDGRQVYQLPIILNKQLIINTRDILSKGVYFIKVTNDNGSQTKKLIVK